MCIGHMTPNFAITSLARQWFQYNSRSSQPPRCRMAYSTISTISELLHTYPNYLVAHNIQIRVLHVLSLFTYQSDTTIRSANTAGIY